MAYRYLTRKINGKTKLLHRHVMEQELGRPLLPTEHVHHKADRKDNVPEKLEVLGAAEHRKHHADERLVYPRDKACEVCGSVFTPKPSKRKLKKTCSKACADTLRSRTERATKAAKRAQFAEQVEDVAA